MSQASLSKGFRIHTIDPTTTQTHTAIILHGRGSNGPEFALDLFSLLTSQRLTLQQTFPSIRWIIPSARNRYSTPFQEDITEWFDIYSLTDPSSRSELQKDGLRESVEFIQHIICEEMDVVEHPRNIILAGISQGCATGLHVLLSLGVELGGFLGFCGWAPFKDELEGLASMLVKNSSNRSGNEDDDQNENQNESKNENKSKDENDTRHSQNTVNEFYHNLLQVTPIQDREVSNENNRDDDHDHDDGNDNKSIKDQQPDTKPSSNPQPVFKTPIFLSHSSDDEVVDFNLGRDARDVFRNLGFDVTWKTYSDGGHWIQEPRGYDDIVSFLESRVGVLRQGGDSSVSHD